MSDSTEDALFYDNEPYAGGWGIKENFDQFLRWAFDLGCSDIKMTATDPVSVRLNGSWHIVTKHVPSNSELMLILGYITNNRDADSHMKSGKAIDRKYEIFRVLGDHRSGRIRMRMNATACYVKGDVGGSLTMRFIPEDIMSLESQGVPDELLEHLFPHHGLISISGIMGSGKTTLLAAVIEYIRKNYQRSVMTLEKPIEFDLTNVPNPLGPIEQIEIPGMIDSFAAGVISSTRKAVDVLLLGETNDRPTMEAMIQSAEVGIAVYHTVHTMSVSTIPARIIHNFSEEEAPGIAVSFLSAARVLIQQRLIKKVGGGRVPLREWLIMGDNHRQHLIDIPVHKITSELEKIVQRDGHSLLQDAEEKLNAGLISAEEFDRIYLEKKTSKKE